MSNHRATRCKFTQEQKVWVSEMVLTRSAKSILNQFNEMFGAKFAYVTFCEHIKLAGIKSSKTMPDALPLGSVRYTRSNGMKQVKVNNIPGVGHDRDNWKSYSTLLWQEHFGKVPEGYIVVHLNHNPLDDRIENLACVTRAECCKMGRRQWFTHDIQLTKAGIQQIRLQNALMDAK